ncbi:MAG: ANTAR domain-containing response regulator [Actinomycetota bacterium]|nr:response regulator [Actinomycetota bacterium]
MTGRLRVLIAEDETIIRMDLREMLEEEGYEVMEAADGDAAVAIAREAAPDLVILDIKMPGRDGLSAAKEIAADRIAPVLILTAYSQRELIARASEAGAMGYLVKPFQKTDLLPAIEIARGRYEQFIALAAEVGDLTERLETRKLIDRAKGRLMDTYRLPEGDAFRFLQKAAMEKRVSMKEIAERVLDGSLEAG